MIDQLYNGGLEPHQSGAERQFTADSINPLPPYSVCHINSQYPAIAYSSNSTSEEFHEQSAYVSHTHQYWTHSANAYLPTEHFQNFCDITEVERQLAVSQASAESASTTVTADNSKKFNRGRWSKEEVNFILVDKIPSEKLILFVLMLGSTAEVSSGATRLQLAVDQPGIHG